MDFKERLKMAEEFAEERDQFWLTIYTINLIF